jgi:hypothetical protein
MGYRNMNKNAFDREEAGEYNAHHGYEDGRLYPGN